MRGQPKTIWNIAANVTGVIVNMISGLLVMPYLIQTLGNGTYGLWILIGTLTGYFGVLDLGVSAAVGRLIAIHRARREPEQISAVMSTALALLLVVSVGVCVATCIALPLFPVLFTVPASSALDVRYSLILVGFSLALAFPSSIFSGLLWGFARFDLQNAVDIPTLILRTVLTMTLVSTHMPLITLGVIVLVVNTLNSALKMLACYKLVPHLHLSLKNVRRSRVREIFSIGGWLNVIAWSRTLIPQIAPTLIGARLGSASVTNFTVARQLVVYANIFSNNATQVMTPAATGAYATKSVDAQRRLFIEGGKFAYALTLFLAAGIFCLGLPFIHWWQHGLQDAAYRPLLILMLGETLPMSQWLTYSVLLGAGRQRALALLAVSEGALSLPLIVGLIGSGGVTGVSVAVALAAFVARGAAYWVYGCRMLRVSLIAYTREVFVPVTLAAAPAIIVLYAGVAALHPQSFGSIFALGLVYSTVLGAILAWAVFGFTRLRAMLG
ncbi:MAG TPA: oligosaccharide flippase family protein [Steroidobacteraceae bacterium]|jgi:O-antigen/teichoic acid export membrane protein